MSPLDSVNEVYYIGIYEIGLLGLRYMVPII